MNNKDSMFEHSIKLEAIGTKFGVHGYIKNYYSKEFTDKREAEIKLLEIGVRDGGSLYFWASWFINSIVEGVDINPIKNLNVIGGGNSIKFVEQPKNFIFHHHDAYSDEFIKKLQHLSYDYIIEDGSHELNHQLFVIEKYYTKLKKGGKLIIEDVGFKDRTTNINLPSVEKAVDSIVSRAESVGYENIKIYDFRKEKTYFSVIIELTK